MTSQQQLISDPRNCSPAATPRMTRSALLAVCGLACLALSQAAAGQIDQNCDVQSIGLDGKVTKRPCYDAGVTVAEVKDLRAHGKFQSCTGGFAVAAVRPQTGTPGE